jgi:DNA polymerase-4
MSHQHVLAPAERSLKAATPTIRQLLIRAAQRLRREDFYCKRLSLDIKWTQDLGHYVVERNFHETQDTTFLLHILAELWQKAPNHRPLRVGVVLHDLVTKEKHQPDLFELSSQGRKPAELMTALDKLNEKFGRGTVSYGDAIPELTSKIAFQRVPGLEEM